MQMEPQILVNYLKLTNKSAVEYILLQLFAALTILGWMLTFMKSAYIARAI